MKHLAGAGKYLLMMALTTSVAALGLYELTAKSPTWLGQPLPGWQVTRQVELSTGWNQPTGLLPLDKFLHESEEAARFYGFLAR